MNPIQQTEHNVMIDIETLSSEKNAAVITIGLAAFNLVQGVTETLELKIDMDELHGDISASTVHWWLGQSEAARKATFGDKDDLDRMHPYSAAMAMAEFIDRHGGYDECLVWANSPSFDVEILRTWWKTMPSVRGGKQQMLPTRKFPVSFRNERDCRTVFDLGRRLDIDTKECWTGTAHSAVDDACNQARAVVKILNGMQYLYDMRSA